MNTPGVTLQPLRDVRRRLPFRVQVPHVIERHSQLAQPLAGPRLQAAPHHKGAAPDVRHASTGNVYWGIEETDWNDAPILGKPNNTRRIKGRQFDFYYSGSHLHMVALRTPKATYWVVNTLLDELSNETMIAIARGLAAARPKEPTAGHGPHRNLRRRLRRPRHGRVLRRARPRGRRPRRPAREDRGAPRRRDPDLRAGPRRAARAKRGADLLHDERGGGDRRRRLPLRGRRHTADAQRRRRPLGRLDRGRRACGRRRQSGRRDEEHGAGRHRREGARRARRARARTSATSRIRSSSPRAPRCTTSCTRTAS